MPILLAGDLHWNDNPRDYYRHRYVATLARIIRKHKVQALFILGDLTEEKDRHSAWLVSMVFGHIKTLSELCPVFIIRGNHDYLLPDNPFFSVLQYIDGVVWINEPLSLNHPLIKDEYILCLPHTRDAKKDWAGVTFSAFHWIFTHNTFQGARSETGVELDGIPMPHLDNDQIMWSGDIHTPQRIGRLAYVGAPYPIYFGDEFRGRVVLLDEDNSIKSVYYKGARKILLEITPPDFDIDDSVTKRDILKIRIHLPLGEHYDHFHGYKKEVLDRCRRIGCKVQLVQAVLHSRMVPDKAGKKLISRRSDKELLLAYADSRGVSGPLISTGLRLLRGG